MELREYVDVLRRRWAVVLTPLLLAGVAVGLLVGMTPAYESTTILYARASDAAIASGSPVGSRLSSYADLVQQPRVARAVAGEVGLPGPVERTEEKLSASVRADSLLLFVSAEDSSPERAQELSAAAASRLVEVVQDIERQRGGGGASPPPVRLIEVQKAPPGTTQVVSEVASSVGFASALGLVVGVVLALLRESLDTTVRSARDLADVSGVTLPVRVPADRAARRDPVVALARDPDGPRAEAFRRLRVRLFPPGEPRARRSLLVAGTTVGDGASSTAYGLAYTLAQSGLHVVLVGADVASTPVSEYAGLVNGVGLGEVLAGTASLDEATVAGGEEGLSVVPPGNATGSVSDLLRLSRTSPVLEELQERYDVVVVDAPPLLSTTEAAVLGSVTGGVVLVARYGRTRRDHVREAAQLCGEVGARVGAAVLGRAPSRGRRAPRSGRARGGRAYAGPPRSASRRVPREEPAQEPEPSGQPVR